MPKNEPDPDLIARLTGREWPITTIEPGNQSMRDGTSGRTLVSLIGLMDRYGFSERWWRARVAEGLPHRKWGARLRFDPNEVERWLDDAYKTG